MLHCCLWLHTLCCRVGGRDVTQQQHGIALPFLVPSISSSFHLRRCNSITPTPLRCRGSPATWPPQRRWCPGYHWGQAPPSVNKTKFNLQINTRFNSLPDHSHLPGVSQSSYLFYTGHVNVFYIFLPFFGFEIFSLLIRYISDLTGFYSTLWLEPSSYLCDATRHCPE